MPGDPWSAGSAVAGGAISAIGGGITARRNRRFARKEAKKNREFQREMSSTAYQRSTADMKKAGLNPMLAIAKGGASTPGGATAQSQADTDIAGKSVSTALAAARLRQELKNMKHTGRLISAQADGAEYTNVPKALIAEGITHAEDFFRPWIDQAASSAKGVSKDSFRFFKEGNGPVNREPASQRDPDIYKRFLERKRAERRKNRKRGRNR